METYMIEQLAALAEHKTLSKVAEVLHISQPAISRSMQKLEEELGVKIFERTKNRIILNEIGEIAAKHAQHILSAHRDMLYAVRESDRRRKFFTFGAIAPAPIWELTPIISQLYLGMGIHSELHETETELIQGLENDVYRVIILLHPLEDKDSTGNPLYISTPFIQENLALLISKTHRLARKKSLFLKDLAGEKLLIHNKIGFWYQVCKTKIPNALFLEQNDLAALSEIANASALPTFVTNMSDRIGIQPSEKLAIPILDKEVNVQFWCICKASKKKDYAALLNAIALVQR